ncbi:hypothetical protein ABZ470_21045 [Streptosporangium sp. NPDC020072]|uniref:hypothetical protein n=1 Tax=Streptosporangium sp. NPDC020072 TaxID=3154788 RepID=UPI0034372E72
MALPQNPPPGGCPKRVVLTNGGFEQPQVPNRDNVTFLDAGQVPGWQTNDSRNQIEFWPSNSSTYGVPSAEGTQFVELNANSASMLYQDLPTTPGQKLYWRLRHRGRSGNDVMQVHIGPVPAQGARLVPNNNPQNLEDGTGAWGTHSGVYTVPAGQDHTRFGFVAIRSAGGSPSVGNFLDDIVFGTAPCVVLTKKAAPDGELKIGDTVTYEVTAVNEGGSPADNLVLTDAVPPGTSLVPGSPRIVNGPGAGSDERASYDPVSRTVTFRLGEGATADAGGRLDPSTDGRPVSTTVRFQVRIERTAGGHLIENQAKATYDNTLENPVEHRDAVSNAVTTPVRRPVDLGLTKAADRTQVGVGEVVTFHLLVTNHGPGQATGVKVTDRLPRHLTYLSAHATGGTGTGGYDPASGVWNVGTLDENASARLELKAVVTRPGAIRNTAAATANETPPDHPVTTSTLVVCALPPQPCPPRHSGGHGGGCGGGCAPFPPSCPETCGHTVSGRTEPGQGWQVYTDTTITLQVDTGDAEFAATPVYVASISSTGGSQWLLSGATGIYDATPTGFRVYVRWTDGGPLSPADAERYGWYVTWIGNEGPTSPQAS